MDLVFQWASEAETIKGHNELLNAEAVKLTRYFAKNGHRTAVLKGPANARLYPDPYMRQAGDIDLWVEGSKESIDDLAKSTGLEFDAKDQFGEHHLRLLDCEQDIDIEIHYRPSSGNQNPFTNARLQRFLAQEIQNQEMVPEGFCVPTIRFALVMQLAHIQRHFLADGIGFKQIVDYFILLQKSSEEDRSYVSARLGRLGLKPAAGALMWLLERVLGLEKARMLCKPDSRRGKRMLVDIGREGVFGFCNVKPGEHFFVSWSKRRMRELRLLWFSPFEIIWHELRYWMGFVKSIPLRVRLRKVSVWDEFH
jgi:hypothetical protein